MRLLAIVLLLALAASAETAEVKALRAKAERGDVKAQAAFGNALVHGNGIPRDTNAGLDWLRKAARQGNVAAMHDLGVMYYNGSTTGLDVPTDYRLSWLWFSLAAHAGDKTAAGEAARIAQEMPAPELPLLRLELANALLKGELVPADDKAGIAQLRALADEGSADAALRLAILHLEGKKLPADPAAAARLCHDAEKGRPGPAYYCLAQAELRSPTPDWNTVLKHYNLAAEHGNAVALNNLAALYAEGAHVKQDRIRAYAFYSIAATSGIAAAQNGLEYVKSGMTPKEIEKGEKERAAWIMAHRSTLGTPVVAPLRKPRK